MTIEIPTVIVGTRFRGAQAVAAVGRMHPGDTVQLVREPDNPHDHQAIACHFEGIHIGYLPRQVNTYIAARLDAGLAATCIVREPAELHGAHIRVEPKITVSW